VNMLSVTTFGERVQPVEMTKVFSSVWHLEHVRSQTWDTCMDASSMEVCCALSDLNPFWEMF
jgi:hypothetical protein